MCVRVDPYLDPARVRASETVVWVYWLRRQKEHDKSAENAQASSDARGGRGLRRTGGSGKRGSGRLCAAPVTCLFGTVAGAWQAGERNTTQRELWGLGERESWRYLPRLCQTKKKMKRRDRSATNN